ncbi:MAG: translation initiation factor IF-2 [Planctomycetes bacterium]|nr:translation initiation factor IF-2 [Planctomycetota bacterium]
MSVKPAEPVENTAHIQAHVVYKHLGLTLKDLKTKCAEIGIDVKGAVHKFTDEDVARIRKHLGVIQPVPGETVVQEVAPPAETAPEAAALPRVEDEETRRKSAEEDARRQAEAETRRVQEAEQNRRTGVAARLGVKPEVLEYVGQLLGINVENEAEVDEATIQRAQKLESVFKIAEEYKAPARDVVNMARAIGLDIGRKGFKGLSPNETFMLRALVKQKFTTVEQRLKEVTAVVAPAYKPAPPTGNKAETPREETRQRERPARPAREGQPAQGGGSGGTAAVALPERFRNAGGGSDDRSGRKGRERFEISQIAFDRPRGAAGRRRGKRGEEVQVEEKKPELPTGPLTVEMPLNLRQLSEAMGVKTSEIMARMMKEGLPLIRINDTLSKDLIEQIGIIFERQVTVQEPKGAEELIQEQLDVFDEAAGEETPRAPVVTIMGHVDHGKTSLLDAIATMERAAGESGGITQHIGAFRVDMVSQDGKVRPVLAGENVEQGKRIRVTFIDTPGHEAFTAMRARGATVTDIAVIVVSADDGVMPQTQEAVSHARAAGVEIVVAITKVDKPEANVMKVRQQLAGLNLMSPDWGGNTEIVEVSSITKQGLDTLIQVLSDMSELLELKAVHEKPAVGTVLEAHRDPGRGIVATMLVKEGTLRRGDVVVAGHGYGRVRAMQEARGDGLHPLDVAGPATAVEVAGLDELPEAGSLFHGMKDIKKAAEIAAMVRMQERELERSRGFSLEEWARAKAGQQVKELVVVLKCDVQGSAETIRKELEKLQHDEVRVKVIHAAVGQITTTDVHLAEAAGGIVLGFHVGVDGKARELADNHHVDLRTYEIIYRLIDEVRDALGGLLAPEVVEVYLGSAEVRRMFKISKVGRVAGCMVTRGVIKRDAKIRVVREGAVIYQSDIVSLKREKDDASEVREGFECGIQVRNYDDVKEGDILEAFRIEERRRSLS